MLLDFYTRQTCQHILWTTQEMYDHPESILCEISQLYVKTRRMRRCASPPPDCLQGFLCLLGFMGLSPLLDMVKSVDQPLRDEVWGQSLALTPVAPYLYPSVQVLALSLEWSLAAMMVHPVYLMQVVLMSLLYLINLFLIADIHDKKGINYNYSFESKGIAQGASLSGVVSSFCTSCTPYCTYSYYASFYCLCNSCSF